MAYSKRIWQNDSSPFINSQNLNAMEEGIDGAHDIGEAAQADADAAQSSADTANQGVADEAAARQQADADHAGRIDNPHAVSHGQTSPAGADPASVDTARSKHVSDADAKNWEDHRQATNNPHATTAEQVGAKPSSYAPAWTEVMDKPATFPPDPHTLDSHPDVDVTTTPPTTGDGLVFNGSLWVPGAVSGEGSSAAPMVELKRTSAQSTSIGWTTISWNTEVADVPDWFSSATPTEVKPTKTCLLLVMATSHFANNSNGIRRMRVMKNGAEEVASPVANASVDVYGRLIAIGTIPVVSGDVLSVQAYQDGASGLSFSGGSSSGFADPYFRLKELL